MGQSSWNQKAVTAPRAPPQTPGAKRTNGSSGLGFAQPKDDSQILFLYCSCAMYFTYILASRLYGTLYTGVTSALTSRVTQHRTGHFGGFTRQYGVHRLVWYEPHDSISVAIRREKRIKHWPRAWKINLIEAGNPHWRDLYPELLAAPAGPLTGIAPPNV